jgi:diguanylate cyclase (GGDEF)-like protein
MVRAVVVLATAGAVLAVHCAREFFLHRYAVMTCLVYLCWGIGIEAIILLTQPSDPASGRYYAGLILVSMALYTWTYLRPIEAGLTGLGLALIHITLAVLKEHMDTGENWVILIQNCFFLISANIVGLFSLYMRERFSRQAFLLKNALAHDLRLEEEAKRQSEHLSEHDALTGLPNRVRFMRRLEELLAGHHGSTAVAVLFLDLDGFKPVNDQHGHAAGDQVLRCVAERVRGAIRSTDLAARLGGDEFVVALPLAERNGSATLERLQAALRTAIGEAIDYQGHPLRVTASIGAALWPEDGATAAELLHAADQDMYQSKRRRARIRAA